MRPVRFKIVYFREDAAKATDVDRLLAQLAGAHFQREHRENFLCAAKREDRQKHPATTLQDAVDRFSEAVNFRLTREAWRRRTIATGGFGDQNIRLDAFKAR